MKLPEDDITIWNDGYYYCVRQQADNVDHHMGNCYNCREPGHCLGECSHPLRLVLQKVKNCDGINEQRLNTSGDNRTKGANTPPKAAQNQF